ncbi:MAG: beta-lactamase family protein [Acidobacteria bacterium]|nr:beta-lactamase family protein [Acidobacteriota bacterium]
MRPLVIGALLWVLAACGGPSRDPNDPRPNPEAMIARAKPLELATPYEPPPGDPLEHQTSGYVKGICSAVFITGLTLDEAIDNVGLFTGPLGVRRRVARPVVDRERRQVRVEMGDGTTLTARYLGSQGCVTLPPGREDVAFTPVEVGSALPDAALTDWPMGDRLPDRPLPPEIDAVELQRALDEAFQPDEALTSAVVITYRGRLIAERYRAGITPTTPLESWSMGKSLAATLLGVLIQQGAYRLDQPAPIPEWQTPGDPRQEITIKDLLQMSSGLRSRAPADPDFDPDGPYADHFYLYTGRIDSFHWAATRPLQWPPGQVGRYRNVDPVLVSYLIRRAVEQRGEPYLSFPQRALFDRIGIRTMVLETDPYGNFLLQGYEFGSARDWARLGNLYLQDGVWNGERILPEGFVTFVSTIAPAWAADGNPVYGGFFWINGLGLFPIPRDAYFMAGSGGQHVMIIPSHDLVVVRIGHSRGQGPGVESFRRALEILMKAVPPRADSSGLRVNSS